MSQSVDISLHLALLMIMCEHGLYLFDRQCATVMNIYQTEQSECL